MSIASLVDLLDPIPFKSENLSDTGGMWTAIGVSVFLLALLAIVLYVSKRNKLGFFRPLVNGGAGREKITVIAVRRLSATSAAHVIAYAGREYLVIESARGGTMSVQALETHQDIEE